MSLLRAEDIHTYYGESYILQGASLQIEPGEIVALLGRNGAGKTTTLKTLVGLVKPARGTVSFRETDITALPAFKIARMGMGYVPQGRGLFPKMTVMENLKTGARTKEKKDLLDEVLDTFPVLRQRLHQRAGTLSGGEQQALAFARALVTRPSILLLDEPTTGLSPLIVATLKDVITKFNDMGMAILLVEEKVPFALSVADRIYFMSKGTIEYDAPRAELEGRKDIFVHYLGVEV